MFNHAAILVIVSLSILGTGDTHMGSGILVGHLLERGGGTPAQTSYSRRSRIIYQDSCGWQGSGRAVYVQNSARNRSVVTIRESCNCGKERWSRTQSFYLEPGAQQWVGCTRGDTAVEWKTYSIVGERAR